MDTKRLGRDIDLINEGDFLAWKGLDPKIWNKDNLLMLSEDLPCINYELDNRKLSRCLFPLTSQTQPLQCFIDKNNGEVVLLRLEDAVIPYSFDNLVQSLGLPEEEFNLEYNNKYAPAKQYIYSSKGITLYILGNIEANKSKLMAVALYQPTSVDVYRNQLGGKERIKLFPIE